MTSWTKNTNTKHIGEGTARGQTKFDLALLPSHIVVVEQLMEAIISEAVPVATPRERKLHYGPLRALVGRATMHSAIVVNESVANV
eukprot:scaffold76038_cov38-Tisochrysis_lutea.AAC.2